MYGWIFRHLPGPLWVRIITAILLILLVVYVLMEFIFPNFAQYGPFNLDVTINHEQPHPKENHDTHPRYRQLR